MSGGETRSVSRSSDFRFRLLPERRAAQRLARAARAGDGLKRVAHSLRALVVERRGPPRLSRRVRESPRVERGAENAGVRVVRFGFFGFFG